MGAVSAVIPARSGYICLPGIRKISEIHDPLPQIRVSGNHLIVQISLKALGVSDDFTLNFKVSDHVTDYADILSYYVDGDSAPIGRLSYTAKG